MDKVESRDAGRTAKLAKADENLQKEFPQLKLSEETGERGNRLLEFSLEAIINFVFPRLSSKFQAL
jgi:hypothetical protein